MRPKINLPDIRETSALDKQACIMSFRNSNLPTEYKQEIESFIERNILDCGRVSPNCLKAHMINIAKERNLTKNKLDYIRRLFKSRIGYKGYYLDNGNLRRVQSFNNSFKFF